MIELKNLLTEDSEIEFKYPDEAMEGFVINLKYMSRKDIEKLRKRCITNKFNKKTKELEEDIDLELFQKLFVDQALTGWSGLKLSFLKDLLLVDLSEYDNLDEELEFSKENAYTLIKTSSTFDTVISNAISDVTNFNNT